MIWPLSFLFLRKYSVARVKISISNRIRIAHLIIVSSGLILLFRLYNLLSQKRIPQTGNNFKKNTNKNSESAFPPCGEDPDRLHLLKNAGANIAMRQLAIFT